MKIIQIIFITLFLGSSCNSSKPLPPEHFDLPSKKKESDRLELSIKEEKSDELGIAHVFTLKNQSTDTIRTTSMMTQFNRILVIPPDGAVEEIAFSASPLNSIEILPGESNSWVEKGVVEYIYYQNYDYKTAPEYKIVWKVYNMNKQVPKYENSILSEYEYFLSDTISYTPVSQ